MAPRAWTNHDAVAYYAQCTSFLGIWLNVSKPYLLIGSILLLALTWLLTDLPLTPLVSRSAYPREHSELGYSYLGFVLGWVLRPSGFFLCSLAL